MRFKLNIIEEILDDDLIPYVEIGNIKLNDGVIVISYIEKEISYLKLGEIRHYFINISKYKEFLVKSRLSKINKLLNGNT